MSPEDVLFIQNLIETLHLATNFFPLLAKNFHSLGSGFVLVLHYALLCDHPYGILCVLHASNIACGVRNMLKIGC